MSRRETIPIHDLLPEIRMAQSKSLETSRRPPPLQIQAQTRHLQTAIKLKK